MKLTVLKWIGDSLVSFLGRTIEIIFRIILFTMPLGAYLLLAQLRSKSSSIRNILNVTEDTSTWQYVFPGFILVSIDPNLLKNKYNKVKFNFQNWIRDNKYILTFICMLLIVTLLLWLGR